MVEGEADNTWADDEEWRKNANNLKTQRLTFGDITKENVTKQWSESFGSGTRSAYRKFASGENVMEGMME